MAFNVTKTSPVKQRALLSERYRMLLEEKCRIDARLAAIDGRLERLAKLETNSGVEQESALLIPLFPS